MKKMLFILAVSTTFFSCPVISQCAPYFRIAQPAYSKDRVVLVRVGDNLVGGHQIRSPYPGLASDQRCCCCRMTSGGVADCWVASSREDCQRYEGFGCPLFKPLPPECEDMFDEDD
jgi:hypothetical protein